MAGFTSEQLGKPMNDKHGNVTASDSSLIVKTGGLIVDADMKTKSGKIRLCDHSFPNNNRPLKEGGGWELLDCFESIPSYFNVSGTKEKIC